MIETPGNDPPLKKMHPSETVADFEGAGLVQLIVKLGIGAIGKLPKGIRSDPEAVAETIANNVRKLIIDEYAINPRYYDRVSELLEDLIQQRREEALEYQEFLERLIALARQVGSRESGTTYPEWADNGAKRALLDFGLPEDLAVAVDRKIMETKLDRWVGDPMKERVIKRGLRQVAGAG